jgi:hypothetical protein
MKTIIKCALATAFLLVSARAGANPRPLPFTYPVETLPAGNLELEQYADVTPLRVHADPANPAGGRLWEPAYLLQTEFEYGLTDYVELATYLQFEANPQDGGSNAVNFDGLKFEARGRFADAGEWPIDVGIYLELETLHDELSLEGKVLLAKRIGRLHWMANLWAEAGYDRPFDPSQRSFHVVLNPTTGLTYEVTPTFQPGVEYWARGELGTVGDTPLDQINNRIHHFVGPTSHLNFGRAWWSVGFYFDCNNINKPQPGEIYGPYWVRSVLGLDL